MKACQRCGVKGAVYTCRSCGAKCCEHMCSLKKNDKTASCGKCQMDLPAAKPEPRLCQLDIGGPWERDGEKRICVLVHGHDGTCKDRDGFRISND